MRALIIFVVFFLNIKGDVLSQCNSLVINGDFEQGNIGFTAPNHLYNPMPNNACVGNDGDYTIAPIAECFFISWLNDFSWQIDQDHTGGGNFMMININNTLGGTPNFYCTQVATQVGQSYFFEYWGRIPNILQGDTNATVDIKLNGIAQNVPNTFLQNNQWQRHSFTFVATSTQTEICLYQYFPHPGPGIAGLDFAIDDVFLKPIIDQVNVTASATDPLCLGDSITFSFDYQMASGAPSAYLGSVCISINDGISTTEYNVTPFDTLVFYPSDTTTYTLNFIDNGVSSLIGQVTANVVDLKANAFFISSDICVGSENEISVLQQPGLGLFSLLSSSSGSGVVDPVSGIIQGAEAADEYHLQYLIPDDITCDSDTMVDTVRVFGKDAAFLFPDFCEGDTTSPTATNTGGIFSFASVPSDGAQIDAQTGSVFFSTQSSVYSVVYTIQDQGCINRDTLSVQVIEKPTLNVTGEGDICDTITDVYTLEFSGNSPFTASYLVEDDTVLLSGFMGMEFSDTVYSSTMIQALTIEDKNCVGIATGEALFESRLLEFSVDTPGTCEGYPRRFDILSPNIDVSSTCTWYFGDGDSAQGCFSQEHEYLNPGCYDVRLSIGGDVGCVSEKTIPSITCIYKSPTAFFNHSPLVPTLNEHVLTLFDDSEDHNAVKWFVDDNLFDSTSSFILDLGQDLSDTIEICLAAQSATFCADTFCRDFFLTEDPVIYVPNAFTPNKNGINDGFYPVVHQLLYYQFQIYNRWGEQVFNSVNPTEKWDGTYQSKAAKQDMYLWELNYTDVFLQSGTKRGTVFLIR